MQALLGAPSTPNHASIAGATVVLAPTRFLLAFALVLGALWTTLAWIVPDLIVSYPGVHHGLSVWPLGPWIMALGLGELAGLAPFATLLGPWNRWRALLFVVWFGSYAVVAHTRV